MLHPKGRDGRWAGGGQWCPRDVAVERAARQEWLGWLPRGGGHW